MELQRDSQIKHFACEEGFPSSEKCFIIPGRNPRIVLNLENLLKAKHSIFEFKPKVKFSFLSNAIYSPKIDG